jgi:endonuclease YncB( thermonuclease family)
MDSPLPDPRIMRLLQFRIEPSNRYTLAGLRTIGRVMSVYDGDSVTIALALDSNGLNIKWMKARLYGIDTPEMKPLRSLPNRDEIINNAKLSRNRLVELVHSNPDSIVRVYVHGEEKYGRTLVSLYPYNTSEVSYGGDGGGDDNSYNAQLVREGFANVYHGGTKQKKVLANV